MTISSTTRKAGPYAGNGAATAFPFTFKVFEAADIVVLLTNDAGAEITQTLTTHYTVSLNADQETSPGGTVTMVTAPASGRLLTITSDILQLQAVALTNMGGFYPAVINGALDRLTILVQQLAIDYYRTFKLPVHTTSDPLLNKTAAQRANSIVGFDQSGNLYTIALSAIPVTVSAGSFTVDTFSGTGAQTVFTLSRDPGIENNTNVFVGGVYQRKDQYSISGTTLTFSAAPASGTNNIEVTQSVALTAGTPADGTVTTASFNSSLSSLATLAAITAQQADNLVTSSDFVGNLLSVGVLAPPLTHTGGKESFTVKFGDATSQSIYDGVYPGANYFEAINGVAQINAGSTIEGITGIAGYVQNNVSGKNAVGLFGCGVATVNGAAVWGINTLIQDSATRVVGTGTGRTLINEFDFNVMNPATSVIGCSVGGNSLAQPVAAKGYIANVLGTGFRWEIGFWGMDNACSVSLYSGLVAAAAANVNSQPVKFKSHNAADVAVEHSLYGGADFFFISSSSSTFGVKIAGGTLLLDATKNIIIGGNGVVGDRKTGYTNAMTGTANRATAYATSTITLAQLAERVKALQDDLTAHGLIGL